MYLLDTNIISYWMRGNERIIDRIKKHAPVDLSLSTITLAEIFYGIENSPIKKKERRLKIKYISSTLSLIIQCPLSPTLFLMIKFLILNSLRCWPSRFRYQALPLGPSVEKVCTICKQRPQRSQKTRKPSWAIPGDIKILTKYYSK